MTSGLLGGQYVGITAGGAEEYLKSGDRIELVQDALVLENLINQFAANFAKGGDDDSSTTDSQADAKADEAKSGTESDQPKTEEAKP